MKYALFLVVLSVFSIRTLAQEKMDKLSNVKTIESHLKFITKTPKSRNYQNLQTLNQVARYIYKELQKYCDTVYYQPYKVNNNEYKNVIGILGKKQKERIIIGAHYDVAGDQQGADDNASGVTGVLELARLLSKDSVSQQIDLVAFTLEEPPFFQTEFMGSYIHAKSLFDQKAKVKGMICLEMIGFFDDRPNSQKYPIPSMSGDFGTKGDFIAIVHKQRKNSFESEFVKKFITQNLIKAYAYPVPPNFDVIDLSDHINYWKFNFNAVMITDTSFYRNKNYHQSSDQIETLDIKRMKKVIDQVYLSIKAL